MQLNLIKFTRRKIMTISCPSNDNILSVHIGSNSFMQKPEYRLKSRDGQDRSGNHKNSARETDKGFLLGRRYSPTLLYNLK